MPTITSIPDAILADILANHDDDTPRLILADWLDEHGEEERAEFIRTQIAIAILLQNDTPSRSERVAIDRLLNNELRLAMKNVSDDSATVEPQYFRWCKPLQPEWVAETQFGTVGRLYGGIDGGRSQRGFTRGFVSHVRMPQAAWLDHGPAIVRRWPIEEVRLSDKEPLRMQDDSNDGGDSCDRTYPVWIGPSQAPVERTQSLLDDRLFDLLSEGEVFAWMRYYDNGEDPIADLSRACLLYAKHSSP